MDVVKVQFTEEELNWIKQLTQHEEKFEPEISDSVRKKIERALKKVK